MKYHLLLLLFLSLSLVLKAQNNTTIERQIAFYEAITKAENIYQQIDTTSLRNRKKNARMLLKTADIMIQQKIVEKNTIDCPQDKEDKRKIEQTALDKKSPTDPCLILYASRSLYPKNKLGYDKHCKKVNDKLKDWCNIKTNYNTHPANTEECKNNILEVDCLTLPPSENIEWILPELSTDETYIISIVQNNNLTCSLEGRTITTKKKEEINHCLQITFTCSQNTNVENKCIIKSENKDKVTINIGIERLSENK